MQIDENEEFLPDQTNQKRESEVRLSSDELEKNYGKLT